MIEHLVHEHNPECDHSIQPMSVGHFFIKNNHEYEEFKKQNILFILAITDESTKPEQSCAIETFLLKLHLDFQELNHKHDGTKEIKISRASIQDIENNINQKYERELLSTNAPQILVYKDHRYYRYIGELNKSLFHTFLNKLITPYVTLTQDTQIQEFLDPSKEYEEHQNIYKLGFMPLNESYHSHKKKFRGLMVIYDRSSNPQIIMKYQNACERLANREELRMGYIGDRPTVTRFLNTYEDRFQFKEAKNILLLISDSGEYRQINLDLNKDLDIEEWVNKNSIDYLQEIGDLKDVKLLSQIKSPTIILFIDESKSSHFILNHVQQLAGSYHQNLTFTYILDSQIIDTRYELGASQLMLPTATIVTNKGVIYPFRDDQFNSETLDKYVKLFLTNRIRPINNERFQQTVDTFCDKLLQHTKLISLQAFNQTILDDTSSDRDILVYFYSSEKGSLANRKSQEHASFIDTTAQRFKEHQFKIVAVMSYDTYRNGLPQHMINGMDEIPSLYLYPAGDRLNPIKYAGQFHKVRSLMEFVEKYGSTGIKLEERSHLPKRLVTVKDVQPGGIHYDPRIKFDDL